MKRELYRTLEILVLVLVLLLFIISISNYSSIQDFANKELEEYGLIAMFFTGFVLDFVPQYVAPHIGILSAPLFGINIFYAFILVSLGSFLGSLIGFEIGHFSQRSSNLKHSIFGERKIKKIEKNLKEHGRWFIFIAAISPLPYIPIILGNLNIQRRIFFLYGIIPRMVGFFIVALITFLGFY